jgi:hypothetical protein
MHNVFVTYTPRVCKVEICTISFIHVMFFCLCIHFVLHKPSRRKDHVHLVLSGVPPECDYMLVFYCMLSACTSRAVLSAVVKLGTIVPVFCKY